MNILFIAAHQDDEIAFASRIRGAVANGDRVTCVFLTNGAARVACEVRDDESRRVLGRLGVDDVRFLGSREKIADGTLPEQMDRALALLEAEIGDVDEVVTLSWEGGHQDHDAAHLIAAVFAARRDARCIEVPLYNGRGAIGPLFRVYNPVGEGWSSRPVGLREKLATILLTRFYRSQRSTWLGLAPLMLVAPARELTRVVDLRRALAPPHPGPLMYERRFHYPYSRFESHAAPFLQRQSAPR